ncbi:MAG TPA: peptide MFS transporter [Vicinamibacterales bacterium]|jgi:POT family proton-dependent oligopeptide transporter|nr:peptide MFS transporter [Vicinamibacterales bacterium]
MAQRGFFGHPAGLSTLFFTEMWERFSYYGMRALLILFMTAPATTGGLGLDIATASGIYGMYIAMVYMMSLPGGWIADRLIGQRRAVLYGGILIACGHFSMAVPAIAAFYLGLVLIVLGTGLLKPNVSAMVGQIYEPNDTRRDAGFSLFYMGINLGAFFSPLVCGYLGQRINWHYGFASAGVGMTFGLIQYVLGGRRLGDAGLYPARDASAEVQARFERRAWSAVLAGLAVLVAFGVALWRGWLPLTIGQISDAAGYLLLIITVVFFAWLFLSGTWTREERRRLYVIGVFFLAASLFWSVFEQAGSTLNLFADRASHNVAFGYAFPSSWYQSANPIFIILFAPVMAWLWIRLGRRDPSSPVKFSIGLLGVGLGFLILVPAARISASGTLVSPMWLTATYFVHTIAELCLSPVGLSSMTKLAPARIVGLMMGVWFLATSVGNYIGGQLSGLYESLPLTALFGRVGLFAIVAGVLMLILAPKFTRLMGGVK